MSFKKTAIIGVGLIGASFALALKKNKLCHEISGSGRTEGNLAAAEKKGIIDSYTLNHADACVDADLVVLATPVGCFNHVIADIKGVLKKGSIVIDVGSTKNDLIGALEKEMPEGVEYVGTHPIAGSDRSGADAASADLFKGALCIMTPTERTDPGSLEKIEMLWDTIGAKVVKMSPDEHDRVFSLVSHLPHVTSSALVKTVADIDPSFINFSGQGFKDTTRIAMSSPELWTDICRSNRENIIKHIELLSSNLIKIKDMLEKEDYDSLRSFLQNSKELRKTVG
jgi:prephenate dehydrogenase